MAEAVTGAGKNGNIPLLLLTAQLLQALTHGGPHIACSAADGADRRFVQEAFFKMRFDKVFPLLLQPFVFLPDFGQGILTVRAGKKSGLSGFRHCDPELAVNFPNTGDLLVSNGQMLPIFGIPFFFGLSKARPCSANDISAVTH